MKKGKEIFMYGLGGVVLLGAFAITGLLIFNAVPDNNSDMMNIAIGQELGLAVMVVAYFYGSSKGSADKTEHMVKNGKDEDAG